VSAHAPRATPQLARREIVKGRGLTEVISGTRNENLPKTKQKPYRCASTPLSQELKKTTKDAVPAAMIRMDESGDIRNARKILRLETPKTEW
jgi:hypothetical protein